MIDFPLLKTFKVNSRVIYFLNRKFDQYKGDYPSWEDPNSFKSSGYQTPNLLEWEDKEHQNYIKNGALKRLINSYIPGEWEYHWIHFLDYDCGGKMELHNHKHNEDFVLFIYLKTCKTGETVFYLNDHYPERTSVSITPTENVGAIFSSLVMHEGKYTTENKRIFVCGIKMLNTVE